MLNIIRQTRVQRPLFQNNLDKSAPKEPIWILMKQEMMGWQWHQLNHMQIICTSLQRDACQHLITRFFYSPDALPDTQLTVSKH